MPTKSTSRIMSRSPDRLAPLIHPEILLRPLGVGQLAATTQLGGSRNRLNGDRRERYDRGAGAAAEAAPECLIPAPGAPPFRRTRASRRRRERSEGFNWRLVAIVLFLISVF